jgi:hypothetical protein
MSELMQRFHTQSPTVALSAGAGSLAAGLQACLLRAVGCMVENPKDITMSSDWLL